MSYIPLSKRRILHIAVDPRFAGTASEIAFQPGLLKELSQSLKRDGITLLNPDCVQFETTESDLGQVFYRILWMPPEDAESELHGGMHDGQIIRTCLTR